MSDEDRHAARLPTPVAAYDDAGRQRQPNNCSSPSGFYVYKSRSLTYTNDNNLYDKTSELKTAAFTKSSAALDRLLIFTPFLRS